MTIAYRTALLLAALLAITFSLRYLLLPADPPPGRALTVHDPDRDLGSLPLGRHAVAFRVTNASSRPLRVIGLSEA
jgi:hypothetical protein